MSRPVHLRRLPLSLDVFDDEAFHRGLLERVERDVVLQGQPTPAIHLFHDDHERVLDWSRVSAADPDADVGATFAALADGRGVERRVVVAMLDDRKGSPAAFILEQLREDGEPCGWWLALRPFTWNAARVGRFHGAWQVGQGQEGLPPMFAELVSAGEGRRAARVLPPAPLQPDIRVAFGELPEGQAPPQGVEGFASLAVAMVLPEVQREGIDHVKVIRLAGVAWEEWHLHGDMPADLDDMVRYIAQRESPAEAVAVAQGVLFMEEGEPTKALRLQAERGGKRVERIFTFRFPEGQAQRLPSRAYARGLGPVEEGEGWLGVEPMVLFELGPLGVDA